MTRVVAMIRLARPFILLGGVMAYALGVAMAYYQLGTLHWGRALLGLAILSLACSMAHYADEYADRDTDTLARRTPVSGGSGVLPQGLVPPAWALRAAIICAGLAASATIAGVLGGLLPWVALPIVALGLAGGWAYSMPPVALERRGWGEVANALLGGALVPLYGYALQTGTVPLRMLVALLPVTLGVFVNLLGVQWPDREVDADVGRISLPVRLGERTPFLHHAVTAGLYWMLAAQAAWFLPWAVAWISLGTLPLGLWATLTYGKRDSPAPDVALMTAVLLGQAAGWVLARAG